eukprot:scaffold192610_cov41-Prasinocladus_malaysianus.AAC.1
MARIYVVFVLSEQNAENIIHVAGCPYSADTPHAANKSLFSMTRHINAQNARDRATAAWGVGHAFWSELHRSGGTYYRVSCLCEGPELAKARNTDSGSIKTQNPAAITCVLRSSAIRTCP